MGWRFQPLHRSTIKGLDGISIDQMMMWGAVGGSAQRWMMECYILGGPEPPQEVMRRLGKRRLSTKNAMSLLQRSKRGRRTVESGVSLPDDVVAAPSQAPDSPGASGNDQPGDVAPVPSDQIAARTAMATAPWTARGILKSLTRPLRVARR